MPIITVLGPDSVTPELAQVLRDDQKIIWTLAPGLEWNGSNAVQFLPKDSMHAEWPGTTPKLVGADYEADTRKVMEDGTFQFYHYRLSVKDSATGRSIKIRVRLGKKKRKWYDPDVVNEPRP